MAQDFNKEERLKFLNFKKRFVEVIDNNPLINTFAYGVSFTSLHYTRNLAATPIEIFELGDLSINEELRKKIDVSLMFRVSEGEDFDGYTDIENIPTGRLEFEYALTKAFLFKRPNYTIFFILGKIKGSINAGDLSKEDMLELYKLLPEEFLQENDELLTFLNKAFDENLNDLVIK